jgi:hypothetical protein
VCGVVVARPGYAYPEGIPAPRAPGTRIVGWFNAVFR